MDYAVLSGWVCSVFATVSEISIRLWDTWENFYDYVISIDNDSPVIAEFKEFISECKNHEFNHYVYFKFKHIKLEEN